MPEYDDDASPDTALFNHCMSKMVASIVHGEPLAQTYALAEQIGPACLFPAGAPGIDERERTVMFRTMARAIMDQTPRLELRYATRKQPRPGRNERCDCGSGRKFKHCCQPLERSAPMERMNLLPWVLAALPRKRWSELTDSAIDPQVVGMAAQEMLDDDDMNAVVALLEPWFKGDRAIPASWELLLDCLLDAFSERNQPRKKKQLLQSAQDRGDRVIRSSAMQRLATMASDAGDYTEAWKYFQRAQREHADSASLSHLEVILLMS